MHTNNEQYINCLELKYWPDIISTKWRGEMSHIYREGTVSILAIYICWFDRVMYMSQFHEMICLQPIECWISPLFSGMAYETSHIHIIITIYCILIYIFLQLFILVNNTKSWKGAFHIKFIIHLFHGCILIPPILEECRHTCA